MASISLAAKDPDDVVDYAFDFSTTDGLDTGETINSHTVEVSSGLTKDSDIEASEVVTVWVSGGTAGQDYTITVTIVTSLGRTYERSGILRVKNL